MGSILLKDIVSLPQEVVEENGVGGTGSVADHQQLGLAVYLSNRWIRVCP
jgi:hypothetical protein